MDTTPSRGELANITRRLIAIRHKTRIAQALEARGHKRAANMPTDSIGSKRARHVEHPDGTPPGGGEDDQVPDTNHNPQG